MIPLPEAYRRIELTLKSLRRLSDQGRIRMDRTISRGDTVLMMGEARSRSPEELVELLQEDALERGLISQENLDSLEINGEPGPAD